MTGKLCLALGLPVRQRLWYDQRLLIWWRHILAHRMSSYEVATYALTKTRESSSPEKPHGSPQYAANFIPGVATCAIVKSPRKAAEVREKISILPVLTIVFLYSALWRLSFHRQRRYNGDMEDLHTVWCMKQRWLDAYWPCLRLKQRCFGLNQCWKAPHINDEKHPKSTLMGEKTGGGLNNQRWCDEINVNMP